MLIFANSATIIPFDNFKPLRILLKIFNCFVRILFFESTPILLPSFQNKLKYIYIPKRYTM